MSQTCAQLAGKENELPERFNSPIDVEALDADRCKPISRIIPRIVCGFLPSHFPVDAESDLTPEQRGEFLEEIVEVEFFEPWQSYCFVGAFLSQAEAGEEAELDESEYVDDDLETFYIMLLLQEKIMGAIEKLVAKLDLIESKNTRAQLAIEAPDQEEKQMDTITADSEESESDSACGFDFKHLELEELPLQLRQDLGKWAVKVSP